MVKGMLELVESKRGIQIRVNISKIIGNKQVWVFFRKVLKESVSQKTNGSQRSRVTEDIVPWTAVSVGKML